jgi:flavin-dependent dehydrogenase
MSRVDLLVAGGGPAGATLATLAAEAGARVVVVEKHSFPRDKLCGEFVSVEGRGVLERLGVMDDLLQAGATVMDSIRLTSLRGREVRAPLPWVRGAGRSAVGISRRVLDAVLLERAGRAGAEIRERVEAISPILENDRVAGLRLRAAGGSGGSDALLASVTVAADGRRSALARALHPALCDPTRSNARSWFGLEAHFEAGPQPLGKRIELHLFEGGYAGLGSVERNRVNLCLMVTVGALRACGGSPERVLRDRVLRNPALAAILGDAPRVTDWKSIGPLRFGVRRPTSAGALFVGDAAGTIDPYSGEGIAHALRGAEIAPRFALRGAAEGGVSGRLAAEYRDVWLRAFAPATRRVRRIGWLLESWWIGEITGGVLAALGGRLLPSLVAATRTGTAALTAGD